MKSWWEAPGFLLTVNARQSHIAVLVNICPRKKLLSMLGDRDRVK